MGLKSRVKVPKRPVSRDEFLALTQAATESVQQYRAAAQLAEESLTAGRSAFGPEDGTREERIAWTRDSALEFGRVYLPHFFEQPSAEFHEPLDKLLTGNYTEEDLKRWTEELGIEIHDGDPRLRLLAICIFRGGGKSVIAILCDCLRRICHGLDPYLIIGSDTYDQASAQLEDLKDELESNEKIRADFGNLKPDRGGLWREAQLIQRADGRVVWREGRIITANRIRVDAVGRGGKMRGRRFGQKRPTHIIIDDPDNDENVVTKEQRDKSWNWLISAVEPARDPLVGRIVVIGTVIHFDCSIARAVRKTDGAGKRLFTSIKFAAMKRTESGDLVSVWPARFSTTELLAKRDLMGIPKWGAEYMNDPKDPETALFNFDHFVYYVPSELQGKTLSRFLYVDPSKGKKKHGRKKSDFSGFAEGLVDKKARITYLVNAYRKRLSPTAAKAEVTEWYARAYAEDPGSELWVEENSFGDILGLTFQEELRTRGIDKKVQTLLHSTEKPARIGRLSIRVETGGVRFPVRWEREDQRPEWFSEMEDYTAAGPGAYDDTIDAIESLDYVGNKSAPAALGGTDPEGGSSKERMQAQRGNRWLSRMRGFGRRQAA